LIGNLVVARPSEKKITDKYAVLFGNLLSFLSSTIKTSYYMNNRDILSISIVHKRRCIKLVELVTGKKSAGKWVLDPSIIPRLNSPELENRRSAKRNHAKLHDIVVVRKWKLLTIWRIYCQYPAASALSWTRLPS
jgi:hypothetical protein